MASVAEVLDKAADLIEPEGAWIKGAAGRDKFGVRLMVPEIARAVSFCMTGATWRATGLSYAESHDIVMLQAFPLIKKVIGSDSIGQWNDHPRRAQKTAVAKLRQAAQLAREQSQ